MKKLLLISLTILVLGGVTYYKTIFTPKEILHQTMTNLEIILQKNDSQKIKNLFHQDARMIEHLDQLFPLIKRFKEGVVVEKAFFVFSSKFDDKKYEDVISGSFLLKAKIDSKDRYIEVTLVKDKNIWKVIRLVFPDNIDY